MTISSQGTAGEDGTAGDNVAEVIAFPRSGEATASELSGAPDRGAEDGSSSPLDSPAPEGGPAEAPRQWPGQVIDLEQARAVAGLEQAGRSQPDSAGEGSADGESADETSGEAAVVQARHIALRSLAARARSEAELRQKLADRGVERPAIDEVLAGLIASGLIDDATLARDLAQGLSESKKIGPVGIKQALVKRRIPRDIIDQVAAGLDGVNEDTLEELARSRMRVLRGLSRQVQVRRLVGFLARRGYQGPEVYKVVGMVVDEPEGGPDIEPDIQPNRGVRFSSPDSGSAWVTPLGRR